MGPALRKKVSGVGGKQHTARQGDSVESIAYAAGHLWRTVWDHSENKPLRDLRKSPHVIAPGDAVFVPDLRLKKVPCATGQQHRFQQKGVPSRLRVRFLVDGEPRANAAYVLVIDDKKKKKKQGTTDGDGWLDEPVLPDARRAEVRFEAPAEDNPDDDPAPFEGEGDDIVREDEPIAEEPAGQREHVYVFELRHLDPTTEITGAQGRLKNLGYSVGPIDGVLGRRTGEALRAFQHDQGIEVTGELDDATQAKLAEFGHG